jgi:hypothetical protein
MLLKTLGNLFITLLCGLVGWGALYVYGLCMTTLSSNLKQLSLLGSPKRKQANRAYIAGVVLGLLVVGFFVHAGLERIYYVFQ